MPYVLNTAEAADRGHSFFYTDGPRPVKNMFIFSAFLQTKEGKLFENWLVRAYLQGGRVTLASGLP